MGLDTFGAVLPNAQDKTASWVPGRKGPPVLCFLYLYSVLVLKYLANRSSRSSVSSSSSFLLKIRVS